MAYKIPQVTAKRESGSANQIQAGNFVNVGLIGVGSGGAGEEDKDVIRGASGLSDYVDPDLVSAECSYLGASYTSDVDFEAKSGGILWKTTKLSSPYIMKSYSVAAIGSLPAADYVYAVTAIKKVTYSSYGETEISNAVTVTLGVVGKAVIEWSQIDLAEGYRIYRGPNLAGLRLIREVSGGNQTTWEDTGIYSLSATVIPSSNTAYKRPPTSEADTIGYWTGGDASANLAALSVVADGSMTIDADGRGAIEVIGIDLNALTIPDLAAIAAEIQVEARQQLGDLGYFVSGSASLNLSNLQSVTAGKVKVAIDGAGAVDTAAIDFSDIADLDGAATLLQAAIRTATATLATCVYDSDLGLFYVYSPTRGTSSSVAITAPSDGTSLFLSTYFNFVAGAAVAGVIYEVDVEYNAVASAFIITSSSSGDSSTILVTAGVTGTPLTVAGQAALVPGTATDGVTGETIVYEAVVSIQGRNFFEPETYFDLTLLGNDHGYTSALYAMSKKMMANPPSGFGAPVVTAVAVPELSRSTVKAALQEIAKVDVDEICVITDNIDIARDIATHAIYCSRDDIKKERVAIIALDPAVVPYSDYIALAAEFVANGERVCLVYDNFTPEPYIAPMIAAMQAGLVDRATSMLTTSFITDTTALKSGRVDGKAVEYLLSQGVMVLSKNENNVLTIIDDLTAKGPTYDLPGRLVEDELRKSIRKNCVPLKGLKLKGRVYEGVEDVAQILLDSFTFDEKISSWDVTTLSAKEDPADVEGVILEFTYTRMRTLKRVTVSYSVLG